MDFLKITGKTFLVFGIANKKSVAWNIARDLEENGATVFYVVRSEARRESTAKLLADRQVFVCDVEFDEQISRAVEQVAATGVKLDGIVHSIAFADYEGGFKPFHETPKKSFLRTVDISCYSFINVCNAFKELLNEDASCITISISTTRMASEKYGFMAPVKAALESSVVFLAKSFSQGAMPKKSGINHDE